MSDELFEEELDKVYGGVPVSREDSTIDEGLSLEQLDQIKAGLASYRLAAGEAAKAEVFEDRKEELEEIHEGRRL